jgi:hypothetical protein
LRLASFVCAAMLVPFARGAALEAPELTQAQQMELKTNFALCKAKLKGPYGDNYCACPDGKERPVQVDGRVTSPCGGKEVYCAAYRAPWAQALGRQRMWIANIFARDVAQWDTFPDHHDLVRGYILEKYFTETNPKHKLAEMRSYGGLSGAEYEAPAAARFAERYLAAPDFDDAHDYLLAYELQRRYYVRDDQGQIQKIRAIATRIQLADPSFKPLRDATHDQISATLIPKLQAYRAAKSGAAVRGQVDELIAAIETLTRLDDAALHAQLAALDDTKLGAQLTAMLPSADADPVDAIEALASVMVRARQQVASRQSSPADDRRLVDAALTAAAILRTRGTEWLAIKGESAQRQARVLGALAQSAYGAGLLNEQQRSEAANAIEDLARSASISGADLTASVKRVELVVDWAQQNASAAFVEVWAPWTFLLPSVSGIGDDILRSSPLVLFAQVAKRLDESAAGRAAMRHDAVRAAVGTDPGEAPSASHRDLKDEPVCGFLGRKAEAARTLSNLPVSEARFESETIRFYGTTRVPFDGDAGMELNRELVKIGVGHTLC